MKIWHINAVSNIFSIYLDTYCIYTVYLNTHFQQTWVLFHPCQHTPGDSNCSNCFSSALCSTSHKCNKKTSDLRTISCSMPTFKADVIWVLRTLASRIYDCIAEVFQVSRLLQKFMCGKDETRYMVLLKNKTFASNSLTRESYIYWTCTLSKGVCIAVECV